MIDTGLDDLRLRSKELLLSIVRSAAERRLIAVDIAGEKLRLGLPVEDPSVEGDLWAAAIEEASKYGMDGRSAGRLTWILVRDALAAQGVVGGEAMYPPAVQEGDVVRLDVDLWEHLVEPGRVSPTSLEAAEAELAGALGVNAGSLVAFPSWKDAVTSVLRAVADGVGVFTYEPIHPWIISAIWSSGGRPYRIHREMSDCWRPLPPEFARRGWAILVENPDYVTGVVHGAGEMSELSAFSASSGMPIIHLGICGSLSLRDPEAPEGAVSIGGIGCAMGSLDAGISWAIAPGLSDRLRRLRDALGALPRPVDVSSASAILGGSMGAARAAVSGRLEVLRSILSGRLDYCEPSSGPHIFASGHRSPAWRSGVAVARGVAFGDYPGEFRVNFMVDEDALRLGLGRLILSLSRI